MNYAAIFAPLYGRRHALRAERVPIKQGWYKRAQFEARVARALSTGSATDALIETPRLVCRAFGYESVHKAASVVIFDRQTGMCPFSEERHDGFRLWGISGDIADESSAPSRFARQRRQEVGTYCRFRYRPGEHREEYVRCSARRPKRTIIMFECASYVTSCGSFLNGPYLRS